MSVRRQMLAAGPAVGLALFGDLSLFAGLVTQLDAAGLTLAQVGILLSVHRAIRIPANPLVGLLLNRAGRRPLFLLGAVLGVVSTALYGLGYGFWPFLAARLMWGMAWALLNVGGLTIALDLSTPATRGRLSGLYNMWIWIGYATGPLVGGLLMDHIGFRAAMLTCAAIQAVGLLPAALLLKETRPPRGAETRASTSQPLAARLAAYWRSGLDVVRARPSARRAMALNGLVLFGGDGVILATAALLMEQRLGGSPGLGVATASGGLIAARAVLAAAASSSGGRISDGSLGRRRVLAASLAAGALSFGLLATANSLPLLLAGVALSAASSGAALSVLAAVIGDAVPGERQSAAVGVYAAAGDIGSTCGPAAAFALLPLLGLTGVYLLSAVLLLGGLLLLPGDLAGLQRNHHKTETNF